MHLFLDSTLTQLYPTASTVVDGPIDHTDETFEHGRVDWFSPFDLNGRRNNALLKSCVERLQALIKEQYPAFVPAFAGFTADKCKAYTDQMWVKRGGEEERGGGFGGGKALKRVPRLEMEIPEPTMHDGRRVTENGSPVLVRTPYEVKVSDFLHESYVTMTTGEIARHYSGADFAAEVWDSTTHPSIHQPTHSHHPLNPPGRTLPPHKTKHRTCSTPSRKGVTDRPTN